MDSDPLRSCWAEHWQLDPDVIFLNHGSFGACPTQVLQRQQQWREEMERQPLQFLVRDLEMHLDQAREALSGLLNVRAEDLAWVRNATAGVNSVLRSYPFRPGDGLLTTDHAYNACRNAIDFVARRYHVQVQVARIPFPIHSPEQVVESVISTVTPRTRLAMLDHVTSPTGLVMPIDTLIRQLTERNVETLIDGAHAPGMLPLDITSLQPTYYTGNCHKWLCAPKGVGFLYTCREKQPQVRPTCISHGANSTRTDRSRYLMEFDWIGTDDPTPTFCLPDAIRFLETLLPGGLAGLQDRNRQLALAAQRQLCQALQVEPPAPEEMIACLASVPLPPANVKHHLASEPPEDPLQTELRERWQVEVPVFVWPTHPNRLIRVSAQAYNHLAQYEQLADCLRTVFGRSDRA